MDMFLPLPYSHFLLCSGFLEPHANIAIYEAFSKGGGLLKSYLELAHVLRRVLRKARRARNWERIFKTDSVLKNPLLSTILRYRNNMRRSIVAHMRHVVAFEMRLHFTYLRPLCGSNRRFIVKLETDTDSPAGIKTEVKTLLGLTPVSIV
jgi:hypothetical protein